MMPISTFIVLLAVFFFCFCRIASFLKFFTNEKLSDMTASLLEKMESIKQSCRTMPGEFATKVIYFSWIVTFIYNMVALIVVTLVIDYTFLWVFGFITAAIFSINAIICAKVIFQYLENSENFTFSTAFVRSNMLEAIVQFAFYVISMVLVIVRLMT